MMKEMASSINHDLSQDKKRESPTVALVTGNTISPDIKSEAVKAVCVPNLPPLPCGPNCPP